MRCLLTLALFASAWGAIAQDRFAKVEIKSQHVGGPVHMLTGMGGNIAVSIGPGGTLLVDDQFLPLAQRIEAAITALDGGAPRMLLNTHFHADHVGGNSHFGTGTIIAHENVRIRLSNDDNVVRSALPLVTFDDRIRIHFNDDEIDVIHLPGHTDGDAVVWFKNAGVVHMGDLYFNGRFPFIDLDNGGNVDSYLAAIETMLNMLPADVSVIPGHGPLSNLAELAEFKAMIEATLDHVRDAIEAGEDVDAIVASAVERLPDWRRDPASDARFIQTLHSSIINPAPPIAPSR
jgi:glyoxylase-like metal-dependent hydrolase (beta-lactamase superfamily II)